MRRWLVALGGVSVTIAGIVLWRRRHRAAGPSVHLGLQDGASVVLDGTDPAAAELLGLGAGLRERLGSGG